MAVSTGLVLVTGASRGIGAAVAERLAQSGYDLVLTATTDVGVQAVAQRCRGRGVTVRTVAVDVAVEADVLAAFAAADELGGLTGLVANAGIVAPQAGVRELTADRISRLMAVNVVGTLLCVREAVRRMATDRGGAGGSVVAVSSRAAVLGSPGEFVDYAASKAAVDAIVTGVSREVGGAGVRVNGVRPGLIRTDMHAAAGEPGRADRLASTVPLGRVGEPHEVA